MALVAILVGGAVAWTGRILTGATAGDDGMT